MGKHWAHNCQAEDSKFESWCRAVMMKRPVTSIVNIFHAIDIKRALSDVGDLVLEGVAFTNMHMCNQDVIEVSEI